MNPRGRGVSLPHPPHSRCPMSPDLRRIAHEALSLSDRIAVIAEGRIRQVGAPDEIYRRPADRFVASFVGDVNVLRARLARTDGETASVELGSARVLVPARTLQGSTIGSMVDLFL